MEEGEEESEKSRYGKSQVRSRMAMRPSDGSAAPAKSVGFAFATDIARRDPAAGAGPVEWRTPEGYVYTSRPYADENDAGRTGLGRDGLPPLPQYGKSHMKHVRESNMYVDPIDEFAYTPLDSTPEERASLARALREKVLAKADNLRQKGYMTETTVASDTNTRRTVAAEALYGNPGGSPFDSDHFLTRGNSSDVLSLCAPCLEDPLYYLRQLEWFDLLRTHEYMRVVLVGLLPHQVNPAHTRLTFPQWLARCRQELGIYYAKEYNRGLEDQLRESDDLLVITFRFTDQDSTAPVPSSSSSSPSPSSSSSSKGKKVTTKVVQPTHVVVDKETITSWLEDKLRVRLVLSQKTGAPVGKEASAEKRYSVKVVFFSL